MSLPFCTISEPSLQLGCKVFIPVTFTVVFDQFSKASAALSCRLVPASAVLFDVAPRPDALQWLDDS